MNLLLEGPDLKALLLRAAQTGGSGARIVHAEKVRKGGVYGFFTRELFEITIEVADDTAPPPATPPRRLPRPRPPKPRAAGWIWPNATGQQLGRHLLA